MPMFLSIAPCALRTILVPERCVMKKKNWAVLKETSGSREVNGMQVHSSAALSRSAGMIKNTNMQTHAEGIHAIGMLVAWPVGAKPLLVVI